MNPNLQEAVGDPEFAKLLSEGESYYEDAASFYQWDPPNGEAICMLTKIDASKFSDTKLKKDVIRVKVTVEIQQGELAGKFFDISGMFGWTPRNFVGLKTLASVLAGEPITKLVESLDTIYENIGVLLRISTSRTPRKEGGEPWVNHRVTERMDSVEAEAVAEEVESVPEPAETPENKEES